jgi:hypothetical protein
VTAILRIEHRVTNFSGWLGAFEGDPVGRKNGGVRRHRIMRGRKDRDYVLVDLEFDAPERAEAFLTRLRELWSRVDLIEDPQACVVELVEERGAEAT